MHTTDPRPPTLSPEQIRSFERLGYAGLLPFIVLALLIWLVTPDLIPFITIALAGYSAAIASFLGGIHWGIALLQGGPLTRFHVIWGVVATAIAWVAVVMPAYAGLPLLALLLLACYLVDRHTWTGPALRPWLTLRFRLTLVATFCCLLSAANT